MVLEIPTVEKDVVWSLRETLVLETQWRAQGTREQGNAIRIRELFTIQKAAPGLLLGHHGDWVSDCGTSRGYETRAVIRNRDSSQPVNYRTGQARQRSITQWKLYTWDWAQAGLESTGRLHEQEIQTPLLHASTAWMPFPQFTAMWAEE